MKQHESMTYRRNLVTGRWRRLAANCQHTLQWHACHVGPVPRQHHLESLTTTRHDTSRLLVPPHRLVTHTPTQSQTTIIIILLLLFNGCFSTSTWVSRFPLGSSSFTFSGREPLGCFYGPDVLPCHPIISVKALKGAHSTDPNQWPGHILSSSTTGLLIEEVAPFMPALQHQCHDEQVVKVTWHKAASTQQTDGSIVLARWRQRTLPWGHIGATWRIRLILSFLRPTRVLNPNGISIGSAVL